MAIKLYQEDIDKSIDWGGDDKTNGLPVAGEKVQKFIKDSLNKKFGYLYYDKDKLTGFEDATGTNQYVIFADEEDYIKWFANPTDNATLVLARFDAPAPATIIISGQSKQVNTVLLSAIQDQKISFNYLIKDSSDREQLSRMSVVISVTNNVSGTVAVPTRTIEMGTDPTVPINFTFNDLGDYLKEGTNTVSITLTSLEFNVSTTIIFQYRVLNLILTSTFADSASNFYYYRGISLTTNDYFGTTLTAQGTGAKYLRVFIDGVNIFGEDENANKFIGNSTPQNYDLFISFSENGERKSWATPGKHNIQMYFFVQNESGDEIKSQTLYYDFVLTEEGASRGSYILFTRELEQGALVEEGDGIVINTEQYLDISLDYAVYDTYLQPGSNVNVDINLKKKTGNEVVYSTSANVPSSSTAKFGYTFQTYGDMILELQPSMTGFQGKKESVDIIVAKSSVEVERSATGLLLELSALNRSNSEPEDKRTSWEYVYRIPNTEYTQTTKAIFNNVLWNNQSGWIDNCLVLNNGATVTVPMNIFRQFQGGLTFEIEFETANVQDDNANIMTYGEVENGELKTAGIQINACNAKFRSDRGAQITTNYKDGAKQMIQFIFNGNNEAAETQESPYLMYLVVNGILDRAIQFTSTDTVGENSADEFVIGNMDGKATIKIHSIRIYNHALTLDECTTNYIAGTKEIRKNYLKNDIYNDEGTAISIDKILNADVKVPVMIIYGDVTSSIVQGFDKKYNVPVDILYRDPDDSQFNYFAHDAWMSNQGTSSMNYPRRNFRLYFNKTADEKTLRGWAENERYLYRTRVYPKLINESVISQIQKGLLDLDQPITVGDEVFVPRCNKKWTLDNGKEDKKHYDNCYYVDNKLAKKFWHSGIDLFTKSVNAETGETEYKKIKNLKSTIESGKEIYAYGAWTHYKEKDLYTDKWTIKCDYAESSMTHNAGVGRLWGEVMKNVNVGSEGFTYDTEGNKYSTNTPCRTNAQQAAINYETRTGEYYGDIRTSCDGKPIVIFCRKRIKGEDGQYIPGEFGDPFFLGLYNIMTDKGSTPLFGFEDLRDDDDKYIFDASKCECWECLQNGSALAQMNNIKTDDTDGSEVGYSDDGSDNEDRPIFKTYEARWPDNDDLNDTLTNNLETVIRFVAACQSAVKVTVGGKDGYTLSDFTHIDLSQAEELADLVDTPERANEVIEGLNNWNGKLYIGVPKTDYKNATDKFYKKDASGNILYNDNGTPAILDPEEDATEIAKVIGSKVYYFQDYVSQNVTGMSFSPLWDESETNMQNKIAKVIAQLHDTNPTVYTASESDDPDEIEYVEQVFNANLSYEWYIYDSTYNRQDIRKEISTEKLRDDIYTGKVYTFDGKRVNANNDQVNPNAWVTVYLTRNGNNFTYKDEFGQDGAQFVGGQSGEGFTQEVCSGYVGTAGESFKGKTMMDYWKDKKYEHFDVWKLAAYYVYLMRFAAVDQVIKNTMMTTEDGKHYYFINYDNDTVMGVRNDGFLAYDWKIDRESYDTSMGSYAYAGFGSVLWNLLEQDDDFMDKVQKVATAMVSSGVLTYDIAIDMFNTQQAGTWSERLYNNSEMYKYIGIYKDIDNIGTSKYNPYSNNRYLPFLQGSRASHRDWWLRHRFDLYDSKWTAGEYAVDILSFYMNMNASASNPKKFMSMTAGSKFYYTIKANNRILGDNFVELEADQSIDFYTPTVLQTGNPMQMLGAYNAKVLDFSVARDALGGNMTFEWQNPNKQCRITELIIGGDAGDEQNPCSLEEIIGLSKVKALEVLDIRYCNALKVTPDISTLGNLKKFLAIKSNINSFLPAKGVNIEEISLPDTIQNISLDTVTFINGLTYSPNSNLRRFEFVNCQGIDYVEFLDTWYKQLIIDGARRTNYSCKLAFDIIELPQYIGPEDAEIAEDIDDWKESLRTSNPKKVESLAWLNEIRTGLGNNANGEANFNIESGIIKLYGHGENGGLTEEDYYELLEIWPDSFFNASNAAHFDANKSIFITVTSPGNHMQYNELSGAYDIVSGQSMTIQATIFPASNERIITFEPRYLNQSGRWATWNQTGGVYFYNYGVATGRSTLVNDNGKGILSLAEYTNGTDKVARIIVKDSLASDAENAQNVIEVNIIDIVKPDILLIYNQDNVNVTNRSQTVNTLEEHIYELRFMNADEVNVDVKGIKAVYNDTNISENEFGTLRGWIDEETGKMLIGYTPIINSDTTTFRITPIITLADAYSTEISSSLPIQLQTKKISNIIISRDGEEIEKLSTGEYNIVNYITQLSGQDKIEFKYDISIDPSDYNVAIKSMEIDLSNGITGSCNILEATKDAFGFIKDFTIVAKTSTKKSFKDLGDITITIVDEFDNEISQIVNFEVGCFYPDEVKLIKEENTELYTDNNINIDLLTGEQKTVNYEVHVYSIINSKYWVWGEEDDMISERYNDEFTTSHFLNIHPDISNIDISISSEDDPYTEVMFASTPVKNKFTLQSDPSKTEFNTRYIIASYPVTFNGVTKNISNNRFYVARSSAVATNGIWQNLPVGGYFMDKFKKFYTIEGLADVASNYLNLEDIIICICWIYEDINDVKQIITLDPWKLQEDKCYKWYNQNCSLNPGGGINYYTISNTELNYLQGKTVGEINNLYTVNSNPMLLFKAMYDYYRFICALSDQSNPEQDGGSFYLRNTGGITDTQQLAQRIYAGTTELIGDVEDTSLIYSIYLHYKNNRGIDSYGRILTANEIEVIIKNSTAIGELLDAIDGTKTLKNKLFDKDVYYIDTEDPDVNRHNPIQNVMNVSTAKDTTLGKIFWKNALNTTAEHNRDVTVVYYDNNDAINGYKFINQDGGDLRMSPWNGCYCLFSPSI